MTDVGVALLCGFAFGFVGGIVLTIAVIAAYVIQEEDNNNG